MTDRGNPGDLVVVGPEFLHGGGHQGEVTQLVVGDPQLGQVTHVVKHVTHEALELIVVQVDGVQVEVVP